MNHTAKYRGQILDGPRKGEWVYGDRIKDYITEQVFIHLEGNSVNESYKVKSMLSFFVEEVDPKTVGQYIGRKDIDKVEVYEDDICDGHSDGYGVIKWDIVECAYIYVFADGNSVGLWETENLKVIGNLTDNPDLLTQ